MLENVIKGRTSGAESADLGGTPRYFEVHVTDLAVSRPPSPQFVKFLHPGNACRCTNNAK